MTELLFSIIRAANSSICSVGRPQSCALLLLLCAGIPSLAAASVAPQPGKVLGCTSNTEIEALACAYLEAYVRLDIDTLSGLLHPKASFHDSTAGPDVGGPFIWRGRSEILENLSAYVSASTDAGLGYAIRSMFAEGNFVVVSGTGVSRFEADGVTYEWVMSIVTILTFEGNRVREHRDYVHYSGAASSQATIKRG